MKNLWLSILIAVVVVVVIIVLVPPIKNFVKKHWPSISITVVTVLSLVLLFGYLLKFAVSYPNSSDGCTGILNCFSCFIERLSSSTSDWGTFGDYIGGTIGTLFSIVGTVLIYMTYRSQKKTSEEQLELAKNQLNEAKRIAKEQFELVQLQQFETTFFNLLQNYWEFIKHLSGDDIFDYEDGGIPKQVVGIELIDLVATNLISFWHGKIPEEKKEDVIKSSTPIPIVIRLLNLIWKHCVRNSNTEQYCNYVYDFLIYIDTYALGSKKKYIDLLKLQLSDNQLFIIMFFGIMEDDSRAFSLLLEKHELLDSLKSRGYHFDIMVRMIYPNTKFKYLKER